MISTPERAVNTARPPAFSRAQRACRSLATAINLIFLADRANLDQIDQLLSSSSEPFRLMKERFKNEVIDSAMQHRSAGASIGSRVRGRIAGATAPARVAG
jgi:hypothetical protein